MVTALAAWQIWDGEITRFDAVVLLAVFGGLMAWTIWQGLRKKEDALGSEMEQELDVRAMPIRRAVFWLVVGLALLIVSSRILVWGAVEIAHGFGVSDLIIGLTIVAVGTSLPELASSIIAARKGEHDIALGNILGSNLFNTLAVVGIAGTIHPLGVGPGLQRDMLMAADPVAIRHRLWVPGAGAYQPHRRRGAAACYVGYTLTDQYGFRWAGIGRSIPVWEPNRRPKTGFELQLDSGYPVLLQTRYPRPVPEIRGENRFSGRVVGKLLCEMTSAFIIKELRGAWALRLFCGRSALLHRLRPWLRLASLDCPLGFGWRIFD